MRCVLRLQFSRNASSSGGVKTLFFSAVLLVVTFGLVVRGDRDMHCSAGLSCDQIIARYTDDEYYSSPSVSSGCELVLEAREFEIHRSGRLHPES